MVEPIEKVGVKIRLEDCPATNSRRLAVIVDFPMHDFHDHVMDNEDYERTLREADGPAAVLRAVADQWERMYQNDEPVDDGECRPKRTHKRDLDL